MKIEEIVVFGQKYIQFPNHSSNIIYLPAFPCQA